MKKILLFAAFLFSSGICSAQTNDTFNVYFPIRESKVTPRARDYIDSLMFRAILTHFQKLIILGYADYSGSSEYNNTLSMDRAKSVRDYLIEYGFSADDMKLVTGKGKIERQPPKTGTGYSQDRKVLIIVDRSGPVPPPKAVTAPPKPTGAALSLDKAKVNQTISINNIFFWPGNDQLLKPSIPVVDTLYDYLKANPSVSIMIIGNICCSGEPNGHDDIFMDTYLSVARARTIYNYLVSRGIEKDRMKFKGVGNANPKVYPELTAEDQNLNRRVDIKILSR